MTSLPMTSLLARLQKIAPFTAIMPASGLSVAAALETRADPARYAWDGLRRGADPAHPFLIFQYTLAGTGAFTEDGLTCPLPPGAAFAVVVPSAHRYFLPPQSPPWTFFFLLIRHPYLVRRVAQAQAGSGATLALAEGDALLARAITLFEGVSAQSFRDPWALEAALFDFLFEYERHVHRRRYPEAGRDALLEAVRRRVLACLQAPPDVAALAEAEGLSRSHYSHRFKAATGLSPAQWVHRVQLEEAARRLIDTDAKLEAVARATGFTDAGHLCKAFRRQYHVSPGEFRRQMR